MRHSSEAHAGLVADLIDHLRLRGRELKTNAHPLVEITVRGQPRHNRTLVHLVNLSGHSQTDYIAPIPMRDLRIGVSGKFRAARSVTLSRNLPILPEGGYSSSALQDLGRLRRGHAGMIAPLNELRADSTCIQRLSV